MPINKNVLDLVLQLLNDLPVLNLPLYKPLLDDAHLILQLLALILLRDQLIREFLAFFVVVVGGHLRFVVVWVEQLRRVGFVGGGAFLVGVGAVRTFGFQEGVVVEHLDQLWGVGD